MRKSFVLALVLALVSGLTACAHAPSTVTPGVAGEMNVIHIERDGPAPKSVAIDMPEMQMRPKQYALVQTAPHTYEAAGVRFSMAGTWRVTVLSSTSSGRADSFTVTVK